MSRAHPRPGGPSGVCQQQRRPDAGNLRLGLHRGATTTGYLVQQRMQCSVTQEASEGTHAGL